MNQIFAIFTLLALIVSKINRVQAGFDKDQAVADYLKLREKIDQDVRTEAAEIDVSFYELAKCTDKSVIKQISANASLHLQFPCTGEREYEVPWTYDIVLDDKNRKLVVDKANLVIRYLNGNTMFMINGKIKGPAKCKGDTLLTVAIMVPESQTDCTTFGPALVGGHTMIYSQKVITGKCASICDMVEGKSTLI